MTFKICSKCKVEKNLDAFSKRATSKDGYRSQCKECNKQYYLDHKDDIKQYQLDNKRHIATQKKQYYIKNREYILIQNKQYQSDKKEETKSYNQQYRINSREQITIQRKQYRENNLEITHANRCKRQGWGTPKPINKYFEGSHLHHLHIANNHQKCIYIPADLHQSISHAYNKPETMLEINTAAMIWYYTTENYLKVI